MAISVGYSFVVSFAIFKFIDFILPLRVSSEEEELGLDATQHNEAYVQGTLVLHKKGEKDQEIKIEKGTVEELILD
jgi:Amt family ammonium transporter